MKQYCVSAPGVEGVTFSKLSSAKSWMKEHPGSEGYIYKTWSNGDWEVVGKIDIHGCNKTFVANSRQETPGY